MDTASRVAGYIRSQGLLKDDDTVIAGVSGGADSLGLLFLLKEMGYYVHAVHVNHGIRGCSADEDEAYTVKLCETRGIPFTVFHLDVPSLSRERGESLEEAGRRARYEAIYRLARSMAGRVRVAVAHHMDDQAETVIHNMIRGCGIAGLAGMEPVCPLPFSKGEIELVRPLLCIDREEIEDYLRSKNISWRNDETNLSVDYTRNRIRHLIMTAAKGINPRAADHICDAARKAALTEDYLRHNIKAAYDVYVSRRGESGVQVTQGQNAAEQSGDRPKEALALDCSVFEKEHAVIWSGVVREAIEQAAGRLKDITTEHVEEVYSLYASSTSGKQVHLPYGLVVKRVYDKLVFSAFPSGEDWTEPKIRVRDFACENRGQVPDYPKESCVKWFDYDKINGSVVWRKRQQGDFIVTAGGSQKLSDFLKKQKVPCDERDRVMVLCREGESEAVWVYTHSLSRISSRFVTDENTERIMEARIVI